MGEHFCFIFDSIDFKGKLPFELIPGHWFRKATTEEIAYIKKEVVARSPNPETATVLYEYKLIPEKKGGTTGKTVHLPPEEWRYYVISFDGSNDKIQDLRYSANLLRHEINLGFIFLSFAGIAGYATQFNRFISSTFFADHGTSFQQEISLGDNELREINTNYYNITNLDKLLYANISRAITDFHDTKMITNQSVLKVLSYFFIIECIVTHDPSDTIDSLTHQISTKMPLLSKRFQRELDYTLHFPQLKEPENVWKKLYSYRSALAHGSEVKFNGTFKPLLNHDNIREFLKESLKLLLLYTLKEPDFVTDLQRC